MMARPHFSSKLLSQYGNERRDGPLNAILGTAPVAGEVSPGKLSRDDDAEESSAVEQPSQAIRARQRRQKQQQEAQLLPSAAGLLSRAANAYHTHRAGTVDKPASTVDMSKVAAAAAASSYALRRAEEVDESGVPDGMVTTEELRRRLAASRRDVAAARRAAAGQESDIAALRLRVAELTSARGRR
jgi:hypothetical protein